MQDIERMGKELLQGAEAEKLKALANTEAGKQVSRMVDQAALERAAKAGDTAALQQILDQLLRTDAGKKLAAEVAKAVRPDRG